MKKLLLTILFISPFYASAAYSIVDSAFCGFTPGVQNCIDTSVHDFDYNCSYSTVDGTSAPSNCWSTTDFPNPYTSAEDFGNKWGGGLPNSADIFGSNSTQDFCGGDLQSCGASFTSVMCISVEGSPDFIATIVPCQYAASGSFSSLIANAQAGYSATVGSSVGSDVSFVGSNFIMIFMGSGLALLFSLRYWIVAMIIIYIVVYFSFRAFRFFQK